MKIEWSIIKKIIENRASLEEQSEFEAWFNESNANRNYFKQMKTYYQDPIQAETHNAQSERQKRDGMAIINNCKQRKTKAVLLSIASSAAVLALLFVLLFPFESQRPETTPQKNSIQASLILPEGVILTKENHDTLTNIENIACEKELISYADNAQKENIEPEYHTITTPIGKSFSVVLSDGTKVHLNAMSELRYPTKFTPKEPRKVYLKGEGYFEVTKNATPFEVKSSGINVRVYGTKFDINGYDSTNVRTVLLSGSVGVSIDKRSDLAEQILTPNQLANIDLKTNHCQVSNVNAMDYLSWKDGIIKSYDASLGDLILKLGHWYGAKFQFKNKKTCQLPITASFNNNQKIEEIVSAIETILQVKIEKIEGGYIIQ